jgi:hypothetical protein
MKKKGLVHLALTIIVVAIAYFWLLA